MIALTDAVRLVMLQFSFSNPSAVPDFVRRLPKETWRNLAERKNHSNGVMVVEPTMGCSLAEFPTELELWGYELVDAFCQERPNDKDPTGKARYSVVRFTFARRELVEPGPKRMSDLAHAELSVMCSDALWRVRAFNNPFFHDGEEVPGQRALVINLEARTPLFRPDGSVVTVWRKDAEGRRVGEAPLPLQPNHRLRVVDGAIKLAPADQ